MKSSESHFRFNKRQRNGIFLLILIIVILQIAYFTIDFNPTQTSGIDSLKTADLQSQLDSLQLEHDKKNERIFPFNPNYITDFKAYQLGISPEEIDRFFAYRESGKFIRSAEEFQQITQISDSLLHAISPYFKFPEWVNRKAAVKKQNTPKFTTTDLNAVGFEALKQTGISEKYARRIISYRKLLGGFHFDDQLYEVYGLDTAAVKKILAHFQVKTKPAFEKLNINTASFKEVLRLPYIDYALTKKIFRYLDVHRPIDSLAQLKQIDSFPLEKFDRINLYLTVE